MATAAAMFLHVMLDRLKARFICWLAVVAAPFAIVTATDILCTDVYSTGDCSSVPDHFRISQRRPCALSDSACEAKEVFNETEYDVCSSISDPQTHAAEVFGDVPYMLTNAFNDNNCDEYTGSFAYRADGSCFKVDAQSFQLLILNANGSVTWKQYAGVACEDEDLSIDLLYVVDDNYTCNRGGFIYYNNEYPGMSTGKVNGGVHAFE